MESLLPKFFIIDQSLKEMGGHHFDYVRLIAEAAGQAGFDTIIGTHKSLRSDAEKELSALAEVRKYFRETTYSALSHLAGLRELVCRNAAAEPSTKAEAKGRISNWKREWSQQRKAKGRARLLRIFAEDCERFFAPSSLEETDHVFYPTMSEIEFMGLAAFLGNHPRSIAATWHTQFHFSMFAGRPDEFEQQSDTAELLTNAFQTALSRAPYHSIRAYTTSEELAKQYNGMSLLQFNSLPYPVDPNLYANTLPISSRSEKGPLKITVAGGIRREKGQKTIVSELINSIWERHIVPGNVRVNIQAGKPKTFAARKVLGSRKVDPQSYRDGVRIHRHPLPQVDYVDLIQQADVGLFCYDSRRYYSRRAGILSEFLASGKPVIVPAGSWLSQQIYESACQHVEATVRDADDFETIDVTDLQWDNSNVPLSGRAISFNQKRNPFECQFNISDLNINSPSAVAIDFRWQWAAFTSFVEIELTCYDKNDRMIAFDKQIVSARDNRPESLAFLKLPPHAVSGKLAFRNAWSNASITLSNVRVNFLNYAGRIPPRSAVGIIAADNTMLAHAIDEMVTHYDHYRKSAEAFSRDWSTQHDPLRTLANLIPVQKQVRYAA